MIKGSGYRGFRSSGHLFISDRAESGPWVGGAISITGQCGLTAPASANVWTVPYAYTLKSAADTLTSVQANAGAGKLH